MFIYVYNSVLICMYIIAMNYSYVIYIYIIHNFIKNIYICTTYPQDGHFTNTKPFLSRRSQLHHGAAQCAVRQAQVAPAADVREVGAVQETDLGGTWQYEIPWKWGFIARKINYI